MPKIEEEGGSNTLHDAGLYFKYSQTHANPSNPRVEALAQEELKEATSLLKTVLKTGLVTLRLGDLAIDCVEYDASSKDKRDVSVEGGELTIDAWEKRLGFSASRNGSSFTVEPNQLAASIASGATMMLRPAEENPND